VALVRSIRTARRNDRTQGLTSALATNVLLHEPADLCLHIAGSPHNSPSARTGRPEAPPVHEVWAGSSTANRYDRPASTTPCRRHRNGLRPPDPKNERCPAGSVLYVHMRKTVDEEINSSILQLSRRPIENPENHGSEESE